MWRCASSTRAIRSSISLGCRCTDRYLASDCSIKAMAIAKRYVSVSVGLGRAVPQGEGPGLLGLRSTKYKSSWAEHFPLVIDRPPGGSPIKLGCNQRGPARRAVPFKRRDPRR